MITTTTALAAFTGDLSSRLTAIAPAFANHLWQSTVFAAVAGLLTLTLRNHHARARYWLWSAASVKFLIPFSWLTAVGNQVSWVRHSSPATAAAYGTNLYITVGEFSQPFTRPSMANISHATSASPSPHLFESLLVGLWLCGLFGVVVLWFIRWRRLSATVRTSVPLHEGCEVELLARLQHALHIPKPIEIRLSQNMLEPGIFGLRRPVLLWPAGISNRLAPKHLEAILAHELWHVRRRDNLAAALHMIVEALFWFHPLVWWVGARLVDERERACDEQVLELGSQREVYAESILKVCEFCLAAPLACVSGVTGSDLKKRMVHIMSTQVIRKLDFARKLLLTAAAFAALAVPITFGLLHATPSRAQSSDQTSTASAHTFESFFIKPSADATPNPAYAGGNTHMIQMMFGPDGFQATNITLSTLIQEAYGVQADQISGGPDWLNSDRFDVVAKVAKSELPNFGLPAYKSATREMMQSALAQHTGLVAHTETRDLPVYALVVAEGGSKLHPSQGVPQPEGMTGPDGRALVAAHRMKMEMGGGQAIGLAAQRVAVTDFAQHLSRQLGSTVVDKTGLKGDYDFTLQWAGAPTPNDAENPSAEKTAATAASLSAALEQQLGLKLQPVTQPMPIVVIDHIEKPAPEQSEISKPVPVSEEVMNEMILKKVPPVYPEVAHAARIQGDVVLDATIGRTGDVENLRLVSGHPVLAPAAIEAVKQWKYQPYFQGGEPVEVSTQLHVSFTLQ